jgi:hypothetical protein
MKAATKLLLLSTRNLGEIIGIQRDNLGLGGSGDKAVSEFQPVSPID